VVVYDLAGSLVRLHRVRALETRHRDDFRVNLGTDPKFNDFVCHSTLSLSLTLHWTVPVRELSSTRFASQVARRVQVSLFRQLIVSSFPPSRAQCLVSNSYST